MQRMNSQKQRRSPSRIILLGLLGTIFGVGSIFALTIKKHRPFRPSSRSSPIVIVQKPASPTNVPLPEKLEVVQVTLKPTGFDPADVVYPHKKFLLMVENHSGVANVSLMFDGKFEEKPNPKAKLVPKQRRFGGTVDLPPGTYRVSEAAHPKWVFTLTITKDKE